MTMFNGVNRIIFDLDNTLIKHEFEKEAVNVAHYLGIEDVTSFKNQMSTLFSKSVGGCNWIPINEESYQHMVEDKIPLLKEFNKSGNDFLIALRNTHPGSLMDGAKEILEYLCGKDYEIIALTNWFHNHQINILKHLGIIDYFERIYTWDNYYAKPNRLAIFRALENTLPENNLLIGDDPLGDITAAINCGLKTIGFNIDYSKLKVCKKIRRADAVITNLMELKYYL